MPTSGEGEVDVIPLEVYSTSISNLLVLILCLYTYVHRRNSDTRSFCDSHTFCPSLRPQSAQLILNVLLYAYGAESRTMDD